MLVLTEISKADTTEEKVVTAAAAVANDWKLYMLGYHENNIKVQNDGVIFLLKRV